MKKLSPSSQYKETFNSLIELMDYFVDEAFCLEYFAHKRWGDKPTCPHCNHNKVYKFSDGKRYSCSKCNKLFTVKVGTIFEGSKLPMRKWFIAIYLVLSHKKGISSYQLSRDLKVTQKTAWFMLQRIRYSLNGNEPETKLGNKSGEVEVDETYIGGKGKKGAQGRSTKYKTPVFGMIERGGELRATVVDDTKSKTLLPIIDKNIEQGTNVMTDEWISYHSLRKSYNRQHVNHAAKQWALGNVHTNTIEGFWSIFKRTIYGTYHKVTRKHLQKYVHESVFRYNTRKMGEKERIDMMLSSCEMRLKYNTLISA